MLDTPFAVINADDYYGKDAYKIMHEWLCEEHTDNAYTMVGFVLKNTLSDNGGVIRGICKVEGDNRHIIDVVETSNIIKVGCKAVADGVEIDLGTFVSMFFGDL